MESNSQSRKWILTINNPETCGLTQEKLREIVSQFNPDYYCMADEIATTGTYHTHLFFYSKSPSRFSTVKKRFPTAHIEKAMGTAKDNLDYVCKEGKWADSDKAETAVEGTFYEFGTLPSSGEENSPKMFQLLQHIKEGMTTVDIIDESPSFAFKSKDIEALRDIYQMEQFKTVNRNLKVTYLYGAPGTGKTRYIFENHPASEICRITDYNVKNGIRFDGYHGQDVLVFEEFYGQISIESMLNFLDIYPLNLPARYNDRVACYTKVYITSNISLEQQYWEVQQSRPATWQAFRRRIHNVIEYLPKKE